MTEINFDGLDDSIKKKLDYFTKLSNTKPEVYIKFLVEVGLNMIFESEVELRTEFKKFLDRIAEQ